MARDEFTGGHDEFGQVLGSDGKIDPSLVDFSSVFIDVATKGAVGDDTTDDTAAWQAAHDALPSTGGVIGTASSKTYKFLSSLVITKPCTIYFPNASIREATWGLQAIDVQADDVAIRGFRIYSTEIRSRDALSGSTYRGDQPFLRATAVFSIANRTTVDVRRIDGFVSAFEVASWDGTSLDNKAISGHTMKDCVCTDLWAISHISHQVWDSTWSNIRVALKILSGTTLVAPLHAFYLAAGDVNFGARRCVFISITQTAMDVADQPTQYGHIYSIKGAQDCTFVGTIGIGTYGLATFTNGSKNNRISQFTLSSDGMGGSAGETIGFQALSGVGNVVENGSVIKTDESTLINDSKGGQKIRNIDFTVNHASITTTTDINLNGDGTILDKIGYVNTGAGGWRAATITGANCQLNFRLATAVALIARVTGANALVTYDKASVTLSSGGAYINDTSGTVTIRDGTGGKGFINHGSTASTARPGGYTSVEWYGTVQPTNMISGDTWINTT